FSRQRYRIADPAQRGHCAGVQCGAVHDGCIQFMTALGGIDSATSRIEQWVVLQDAYCGGNRIQTGAAAGKDGVASLQSGTQTGMVVCFTLGAHCVTGKGPGAAMNRDAEWWGI